MTNRLTPNPRVIQDSLESLSSTRSVLAELTAACDDDILSAQPAGRAWSPVEVLAHIRSCSDVWSFSVLAMLAEDEPSLALIDPRRWARAAGYAEMAFRPSLEAFGVARVELLRALGAQPGSAWGRKADIADRAHSVYSQVRRMAKHESEHVEQIRHLIEATP